MNMSAYMLAVKDPKQVPCAQTNYINLSPILLRPDIIDDPKHGLTFTRRPDSPRHPEATYCCSLRRRIISNSWFHRYSVTRLLNNVYR